MTSSKISQCVCRSWRVRFREMSKLTMFLCYFIAAFSIESVLSVATERSIPVPLWRYDDESNWPGKKCKEGGKRQSPIDIRLANVVMDDKMDFIKHGKLHFMGYRSTLVTGLNNGHTIQFAMEGSESMHPTLTGGPLKHSYRLEQLHFHWLSEHAVDGVKFPMEIHFVHVRKDLPVTKALSEGDGLAIIAVFCNVKMVADLPDNGTDMVEVMQHLPELKNFGSRKNGILLDLMKLMSVDPQEYITYAGSLTSPECNEVVTWIIMERPLFMSDAEYESFNDLGVTRYNFRGLKPFNGTLYRPSEPAFKIPLIFQLFNDIVDMVVTFFRNVTTLAKQSKALYVKQFGKS